MDSSPTSAGPDRHPAIRAAARGSQIHRDADLCEELAEPGLAIEGSNGAGRPLAQRLLEAGEHVVDVPAKLAARVRLFHTGHNRKTDARDAHSIATAAIPAGHAPRYRGERD